MDRCAVFLALLLMAGCARRPEPVWQPLFPASGVPEGWVVRAWDDVAKPGPAGSVWEVRDGVLTSQGARGCWLMWTQELGDFDLDYEFRLGRRGNSGLALRAPLAGDPAFDGMELQMADYRYNTNATPAELTGGLYRALAPQEQVYKPEVWNRCELSLRGTRLLVRLNGVPIHDRDLAAQTNVVQRHDGRKVAPLRDRPRRGHIGFQELSRDGGHVEIRHARFRVIE
ncbi:MAG: DUF1080 domain-containing protein [Verrucomicrobia bacterium]|nr:DUF1080 domain-containing protein [Verrucomicrobiota bacterium]